MDILLGQESLIYYNHDLVAKTAVSSLYDVAYDSTVEGAFSCKKMLEEKNGHNAVAKNALDFLFYQLPMQDLKAELYGKKMEFLKKISESSKELSEIAKKKILPGCLVVVDSINNHIYDILYEASKYKKFEVRICDGVHFGLGSRLKESLAKHKVKTTIFPQGAPDTLFRHADICLIGADLITGKGGVVKLGAKATARHAADHHVPVYVCATSWKLANDDTVKNALSLSAEHAHYGNQPIYEFLPAEHATRFLCEFGIVKPDHLIEEARLHHRWMFT